jgi:hypothetical protein
MRLPTKGCLFALLIAMSWDAARAQQSPIQKGSVQIGGTASFAHERDIGNDFGWTSLELAPRVGYFIARGLAVSGNLRFQRIWYDDQETIKDQRALTWGIGPGLTYYVPTRFHRLYPFASARTLFLRGSSHSRITSANTPGVSSSRSTNDVWLLSAGALYMVGNHVGITSELFYQHEYFTARYGPEPTTANSSEMYGLQWGITAFVF